MGFWVNSVHSEKRVFLDERVVEYLLHGWSLRGILLQYPSDEVPRFFTHVGGFKLDLVLLNGLLHLERGGSFERGIFVEHFVKENTQCPDVDTEGLRLLVQYFRCHVFLSSAKGGSKRLVQLAKNKN